MRRRIFHLYSRVLHVCHMVRERKRREKLNKMGEHDCIFPSSSSSSKPVRLHRSERNSIVLTFAVTYVYANSSAASQILVRNSIQYCICSTSNWSFMHRRRSLLLQLRQWLRARLLQCRPHLLFQSVKAAEKALGVNQGCVSLFPTANFGMRASNSPYFSRLHNRPYSP